MRRLLYTSAVCVVALSAAWGLGGAGLARPAAASAHPAAPKAPAHLLVYAQEWSLWPSRTKLPAGAIDVQLWNRGQDAHDLRVRRLNASAMMVGPVLGGVAVTLSGDIHTAVWHLKSGRYEIYCSLPGHLMMGMHTTITVVA